MLAPIYSFNSQGHLTRRTPASFPRAFSGKSWRARETWRRTTSKKCWQSTTGTVGYSTRRSNTFPMSCICRLAKLKDLSTCRPEGLRSPTPPPPPPPVSLKKRRASKANIKSPSSTGSQALGKLEQERWIDYRGKT